MGSITMTEFYAIPTFVFTLKLTRKFSNAEKRDQPQF